MTEELSSNISWSDKLEKYFVSTAERAYCLSWLHKKSEGLYSKRKTFIDLPVIVLSGVIAFLNAGSSSLFADDTKLSSISLGIGSLFVSVLNTIGSYFSWSKRAENHRLSGIHYNKLYRFITIELHLPRNERIRCSDLLKMVKESYDRLLETSPAIPDNIIAEFKKRFSNEKYESISRPEEANGLESVSVYGDDIKERKIEDLGLDSYVNPVIKKVDSLSGFSSNSNE
jgi:hypothetical protein